MRRYCANAKQQSKGALMGDIDEPVVEAEEYEYESEEETPTDLGEVTEGEITTEEVPA